MEFDGVRDGVCGSWLMGLYRRFWLEFIGPMVGIRRWRPGGGGGRAVVAGRWRPGGGGQAVAARRWRPVLCRDLTRLPSAYQRRLKATVAPLDKATPQCPIIIFANYRTFIVVVFFFFFISFLLLLFPRDSIWHFEGRILFDWKFSWYLFGLAIIFWRWRHLTRQCQFVSLTFSGEKIKLIVIFFFYLLLDFYVSSFPAVNFNFLFLLNNYLFRLAISAAAVQQWRHLAEPLEGGGKKMSHHRSGPPFNLIEWRMCRVWPDLRSFLNWIWVIFWPVEWRRHPTRQPEKMSNNHFLQLYSCCQLWIFVICFKRLEEEKGGRGRRAAGKGR